MIGETRHFAGFHTIAAVRQLSARYALRKQSVAGTHTDAETRLLSAHYRPLLTHYRPIIDHYKPYWTAARAMGDPPAEGPW